MEAQPLPGQNKLRIALVTPHYPPMRTSAAVQVRDLAQELLQQNHEPTVIVPSSEIDGSWVEEDVDGVQVLRLAVSAMLQGSYLQRTWSELALPFMMIRNLKKSTFGNTKWDLVIWYSPPIFFGPLIWVLKRACGCPSYLILRDIFPEWALDLGILRKGLAYALFKGVAKFQYAMANTIGVQTSSNLTYLEHWARKPGRKLEVLQNWQAPIPDTGSSINVSNTILQGRKIFVYIGNMGVAQGMDIMIDLAESLIDRDDLGFLFVGRGSEVPRLKKLTATRSLTNTLFCDEIDSKEIPGLLAQCHIGLLALDPRHKTHNIPGKFLSYLLAGLPVLARVSAGTDLARLMNEEGVGHAYVGESVNEFSQHAKELSALDSGYNAISSRARALAAKRYSPAAVARQITGRGSL